MLIRTNRSSNANIRNISQGLNFLADWERGCGCWCKLYGVNRQHPLCCPQDRAKLLIAGNYCNKVEPCKKLLNLSLNFIRPLFLSHMCMYDFQCAQFFFNPSQSTRRMSEHEYIYLRMFYFLLERFLFVNWGLIVWLFWYWLDCRLPGYTILWPEKKRVRKFGMFWGQLKAGNWENINQLSVTLHVLQTINHLKNKLVQITPWIFHAGRRWCVHITSTIELMARWHGINLAGWENAFPE